MDKPKNAALERRNLITSVKHNDEYVSKPLAAVAVNWKDNEQRNVRRIYIVLWKNWES